MQTRGSAVIAGMVRTLRRCATAAGLHAISWKLRKLDFDISSKDLVLDVGSGAAPNPYADVLVEYDPTGRQTNAGEARSNGKVLLWANLQRLPFRDRVFDYAMCFHVLEHVDDPAECLRELERVATRGYIETPNELFDIVIPYHDHKNRVSFDGECLRVIRKRRWDVDRFEKRYGRRRCEQILAFLIHDPQQLHVQYRWDGRISWRFDDLDVIDDGYDSSDSDDVPRESQPISPWLNTLASRFIRRRSVTTAQLLALMRCLTCGCERLECSSEESPALCRGCGRVYPRVNGSLDFR